MTEFIQFCREYWFQIAAAGAFIIELVFIIIKRKPKTVDDFLLAMNEVRTTLASWISAVECDGKGAKKKNQVMTYATKSLERKIGRKLSDREFALFNKEISQDIEAILSTPTKKGN